MIVKAEHTALGSNPRFVVTNLPGTDDYLYDRVYCARGDMENRLKDQQRSGALSPFRGQPVPAVIVGFGLYLDTLIEGLRRLALERTVLATARPNRIRLTLLRIGAVVLRHTRRIRILLSSTCPHQELFHTVAASLDTS